MMPLTFSIATGLSLGFISYTVIGALSGKWREVAPVMWRIGLLAHLNHLISL